MDRIDYVLLGTISAVIVIFLVMHFLDVFLIIAAILGISLLILYVLATVLFALIMLSMVPIFLIKKKPEIQEYGNYDLEDIE